jgi:hypothetical protein
LVVVSEGVIVGRCYGYAGGFVNGSGTERFGFLLDLAGLGIHAI